MDGYKFVSIKSAGIGTHHVNINHIIEVIDDNGCTVRLSDGKTIRPNNSAREILDQIMRLTGP